MPASVRASIGQAGVWLPVDDEEAWAIATIENRGEESVELKRRKPPEGIDAKVVLSVEEFEKLTPVTGDPDQMVADLVYLPDVNTGAVLHNLKLRYQNDEIFTAIGPILVVVNPYKTLAINSAEHMTSMTEEKNPETLPPHIYKIAHSAYSKMMQTASAQSILISGESGAGKTETTKLCMGCLAEISSSSGKSTEAALESGVLLEAFGNAKTVHNNNSSRFGKWCAVHFTDVGHVGACKVQSYLLEKSRVVGPGEDERNYHIFYQMMAGVEGEEREKLRLLGATNEYLYLQGPSTVNGVDDKSEWANTQGKLHSLGFSSEQTTTLLQLFSAILLLGNVAFVPGETETMAIMEPAYLAKAAELLQISAQQLQTSVTSRKVASGRGSSYTVPLTDSQCLDTRDALAKAIYQAVFDWIVSRLNVYMSQEAGTVIDEEDDLFVGLLDVFGFENFEFNTFEQLCINYTNEKLQQQFIDALIRLQQQDYEREGIGSSVVAFPDNAEQLSLLDSRMGVMGLLDEECALPKGSEEAYVEKMHKFFSTSSYYEKPVRAGAAPKRRSVMPSAMPTSVGGKDLDKLRFSIWHYAGKVTYTADAWLDKNRGFLQPELAFLLSNSSSTLLSSLFARDGAQAATAKKGSTVLSSFRSSLRSLSATLLQTSARYIRCIKPNSRKEAGHFDGYFISRQLRYTGVSAVVEIQRSGYPISLPKADFIVRYRCCTFSDPSLTAASVDVDVVCKNILSSIQQLLGMPENEDWIADLQVRLGKTKVFLREEVVRHIEKAREAILEEATKAVQRAARGGAARKVKRVMAGHKEEAAKVRAALDDKQPVVATAAFAVLQAWWDSSSVTLATSAGSAGTELRGLQAMQRELGELSMEVSAMEAALAAEAAQLESLKAAMDSAKDKGSEGTAEFVALKLALQGAQEMADGLSVELAGMMKEAEGLLAVEAQRVAEAEEAAKAADQAEAAAAQKKLDDVKRAEEDSAQKEMERKAKAEAEAAKAEAEDPQSMRTLVIEVSNDPSPEKGTGIEINAQNVVTSLPKGGYGAKEGKVRVGDIIIVVDGTPVVDRKAVSAMDEKATSYKLTIQRYGGDAAGEESSAGGLSQGGLGDLDSNSNMEGWLTKVKAVDGRATGWPEKRWVVLENHTLYWYKDSKDQNPFSQSLENAAFTMPTRANAAQGMVPAMQAFAKLHKYPFMLYWPNKSVPHELVFAASTSADRNAWANAMKDAIQRAKTGAPTCGWLFKEGGRKSGLSMSGWKRRWFELPKGKIGPDSELKYYESPSSTTPKGKIRLRGSDVFVPKQVRGVKAEYKHNLCITSEAIEKGKQTVICTLVAAANVDERNMWVKALSEAIKPEAAGGGGSVGGAAPAPKPTRQAPGADMGASGLQAGAQTNLEQMKMLDREMLETLRIKQLKAILQYMNVDVSDAALSGREKKDLVAMIIKGR